MRNSLTDFFRRRILQSLFFVLSSVSFVLPLDECLYRSIDFILLLSAKFNVLFVENGLSPPSVTCCSNYWLTCWHGRTFWSLSSKWQYSYYHLKYLSWQLSLIGSLVRFGNNWIIKLLAFLCQLLTIFFVQNEMQKRPNINDRLVIIFPQIGTLLCSLIESKVDEHATVHFESYYNNIIPIFFFNLLKLSSIKHSQLEFWKVYIEIVCYIVVVFGIF